MLISFVIYIAVFLISCFACRQYDFFVDNLTGDSDEGKNIISRTINLFHLDKWFYTLLILAPPVFIYTFRSLSVGTDTQSYLAIYELNKHLDFFRYIELYGTYGHDHEYGYQLILRISYLLGGGYNLVKFICGFLIVFFSWRGFLYYHKKFNVDTALCMFFFYLLEFTYGFNATRFMIALAIFPYSFRFVIEKNFVKYFLCCFLMTMFHSSMTIAILFYLMNFTGYKVLREKWKYIAVILLIFSVVMIRPLVNTVLPYIEDVFVKVESYDIDTSAKYGLGVYVVFLLFLAPILRWDKFVEKDVRWTCILIITLSFVVFRFIGYFCPWLIRLSRMPEIMFSVLYSGVINLQIENGEKRFWKIYTIILVILYYIDMIVIDGSSEVYPYILDFTNYV